MSERKKKKRYIVVANWKMNPATLLEAKKIFKETVKIAQNLSKTILFVAPPSLFLSHLSTTSKKVHIASQGGFLEETGQYTGGVSMFMAKNAGAKSVILGHSEERFRGETNESVSKKINAALLLGMKPIVCIGELTRDTNGDYLRFLETQIHQTFARLSPMQVMETVVAYEPVWAIGTASKGAMDPRDLHETILYIRKIFRAKFGADVGESIVILYGGSVDEGNASSLIEQGMVQGFLVGRTSLDHKKFVQVLRAVDNNK